MVHITYSWVDLMVKGGQEGGIVVIVSIILMRMLYVSNQVYVMVDGQIVYDGVLFFEIVIKFYTLGKLVQLIYI